jgi:hypothetical protein
MQRFRLMKVYVAAVLMVLVLAITSAAWMKPSQAAISTDADLLPDDANTTQPAAGNMPAHADATKPNLAE